VLLLLQLMLGVEVRFGLRGGHERRTGGGCGRQSVQSVRVSALRQLSDAVVHVFSEVIGHVLQIRHGNFNVGGRGAIALLTAADDDHNFLIFVGRISNAREHVARTDRTVRASLGSRCVQRDVGDEGAVGGIQRVGRRSAAHRSERVWSCRRIFSGVLFGGELRSHFFGDGLLGFGTERGALRIFSGCGRDRL
jgi:hypothetical protein